MTSIAQAAMLNPAPRRTFLSLALPLSAITLALALAGAFAASHYLENYAIMAAALLGIYLGALAAGRLVIGSLRKKDSVYESQALALRNNYESVISILNAALGLQDSLAFSQSRRVVELSSVLAWQMGLRKEQVRLIEKAAILHDVGKIGVAQELLAKPGPLNMGEWEEMRRHPEMGKQVLEKIEFLHDAAEIIHTHHERWDGHGYPSSLRGEDIPLGARIFAVADAYNAMTSSRPYRKPIPHHEVVKEIVHNSGVQFDPQVVKAFQEAERKGLIQNVASGDDVSDLFFSSSLSQSRRHRQALAAPES